MNDKIQELEKRVEVLEKGPYDPRPRIDKKIGPYFFDLPLIHICIGGSRDTGYRGVAKGIIAIGDIAQGGLALGGLAMGVVALGGVSFGLFSLGGLAIGGITLGGGAIGIIALGGGAIGYAAVGGATFGHYALGGAAFGEHVIGPMHSDPVAVEFFNRLFPRFLRLFGMRGG